MQMVRTLISLPAEDKRWLDTYSRAQQVSVAETIRTAVRTFRAQSGSSSYKRALRSTAGVWKGRKMDAARYIKRMRDEWER